jgi:hypothetical protein
MEEAGKEESLKKENRKNLEEIKKINKFKMRKVYKSFR